MHQLDQLSQELAEELDVPVEEGYAALSVIAEEARKARVERKEHRRTD